MSPTNRAGHAYGWGAVVATMIVSGMIGACQAGAVALEPHADAVDVENADPPPGAKGLGIVNGIHGDGCGVTGTEGNYGGAVAVLRNLAIKRGGNYVQILTVIPPHTEALCFDNRFVVRGVIYRIGPASAEAAAASASAVADRCDPPCSPGYACTAGVCMAQCNPACAASQTCRQDRTCSGPNAARSVIALRGARLVDGNGGPPIDDSVVVIEGETVLAAGSRATTPVPADAALVDVAGKTIIPGLITDHSHVGIVSGVDVGSASYNRANILRQLRQYEAYGVTTVTALGLNGVPLFETMRAEMHAGSAPGADLFGVDRGIGVPDGAPPAAMLPVGPDQLFRPVTAEDARQAVRAMAANHTDLVKIWLDDFGGSVPAKMKPEIYTAVIDEAHKQGVRVAAHIHDLDDAKAVVAAGVDILAHGVRDKPVDRELLSAMKARNVWYVATLSLDEATFVYADPPAWTTEAFFQHALQPAVRARIADPAWRQKTAKDPKTAAARSSLAMNLRNVKTVFDAGIPVGFGSDSGATPLRIAGVAEHRELALLVQAGLTPLQAITIATRNAAALLGLSDRGVLTPGKRADLVVLDADPTRSIESSHAIRAVWHRGKPASGAVDTFEP